MKKNPSQRIAELGLVLPPAPPPTGLYKPVVVVGSMLYVSGQGPVKNDGSLIQGRAGEDLNLEEAILGARQVGLTMLATIKEHFGDIDRVKRLVKVLGMVNATPDFGKHPVVINGFSALMRDVFGSDAGVGARSAVGMLLPNNIIVEVEAIFELYA